MKKLFILFVVLMAVASVIVVTYSFTGKSNAATQKKKDSHNGFAVIELFTSEGCSSCPPADAAIANLLSENKTDVYVLSFHVDYWNHLGWKDPFSQTLFSERQRTYAKRFSLESIYTPQIVVNGTAEFVGSNTKALQAAVENSLHTNLSSDIAIDAKRTGTSITITYHTTNKPLLLNLALVQPEATTVVKSGENGGRSLHHVNIVRALKTIDAAGTGNLGFEIPEAVLNLPLQLIAYTQSKEDFKVLSATQLKL